MDSLTQKQILDWKEELDKQKQTKLQAEQVLERAIKSIDMLEGGSQFGEMLLKKSESSNQPTGIVELGQESGKAPSKK